METINSNRLMEHMTTEMIAMSDKLMKAMVERDEAVVRYQKLLTSFSHLLDKAKYYRRELGILNPKDDTDTWAYEICEAAGILDMGEIPKLKQTKKNQSQK